MSSYSILVFMISEEKSAVHIIENPLYMMSTFPAFIMLSFSLAFDSLTMMSQGVELFGFILLWVIKLLGYEYESFSPNLERFQALFLKYAFWPLFSLFSSLLLDYHHAYMLAHLMVSHRSVFVFWVLVFWVLRCFFFGNLAIFLNLKKVLATLRLISEFWKSWFWPFLPMLSWLLWRSGYLKVQ